MISFDASSRPVLVLVRRRARNVLTTNATIAKTRSWATADTIVERAWFMLNFDRLAGTCTDGRRTGNEWDGPNV